MVLRGTATSDAVARLFAIHERTLPRRLAEEAMSLQQLSNQTRFELARQLLQNTGLSVSAIASAPCNAPMRTRSCEHSAIGPGSARASGAWR